MSKSNSMTLKMLITFRDIVLVFSDLTPLKSIQPVTSSRKHIKH